MPCCVFSGEVEEGAGYFGVIGDEVLIETCETKEGSDVGDRHWLWPICDALGLHRVHVDSAVL